MLTATVALKRLSKGGIPAVTDMKQVASLLASLGLLFWVFSAVMYASSLAQEPEWLQEHRRESAWWLLFISLALSLLAIAVFLLF